MFQTLFSGKGEKGAIVKKSAQRFKWTSFKCRSVGGVEENAKLTSHTATLVGSRVFVVGTQHGSMFVFDTLTLQWMRPDIEDCPFSYSEAFLVEDILYVYGQRSYAAKCVFWKLDLVLLESSEEELSLPKRRTSNGYTCSFLEDTRQMVLLGGVQVKTKEDMLLVAHIDTHLVSVPKQTGSLPSPRYGHAVCCISAPSKTTLCVYGGRSAESTYYNDLHLLTISGGRYSWSVAKEFNRCLSVAYSTLTYMDGRLLLYGGYDLDLEETDMLLLYDLREDEWHRIGPELAYSLEGRCRENSAHRAIRCHQGVLFLGGFAREIPWIDILRVSS